MNETYNGHVPLVDFFVAAWALTVQYFSNQIRVTKQSLKAIVEAAGGWDGRWTGYAHSSSSNTGQVAGVSPDIHSELNAQLAKSRQESIAWQKKADSSRVELEKHLNDNSGKRKHHVRCMILLIFKALCSYAQRQA